MFKLNNLAIAVITTISLTACGGGGGSSSSSNVDSSSNSNSVDITETTAVINDNSVVLSLNNLKEDSFKLSNDVIPSDAILFNEPRYGTLTKVYSNIKGSTLDNQNNYYYKYQLKEKYFKVSKDKEDNIIYKATEELDNDYDVIEYEDQNGLHQIIIPFFTDSYDPLYKGQWHLKNTQNFIKTTSNIPQDPHNRMNNGIDINVVNVWMEGFEGNDEHVVAVFDDEIEGEHEDLRDNYRKDLSYNFFYKSSGDINDPSIESSEYSGHGTAVTGIIAANSNGIGVKGIAPNVRFAGYNILLKDVKNNLDINEFYAYSKILEDIDNDNQIIAINQSYGYQDPIVRGSTSAEPLLESLSANGVSIVHANGNNFTKKSYYSAESKCNELDIDCTFSQNQYSLRSPYVINVGALDATGKKAIYGSTGSNLVLSAFGGDTGKNTVKILTTDRTGCDKGFYRTDNNNTIENNKSCNYTDMMNGTSAAAPMVTGVIALLKDVNPNLSPLQIKYILAKSAKKFENMNNENEILATVSVTNDWHSLEPLAIYDGWIRNSAGIDFNNKYGFGALDAYAAVNLAKNCDYDYNCSLRRNKDNYGVYTTALKEFTARIYNSNCHELNEEKERYGIYVYECNLNSGELKDDEENTINDVQIEGIGLNLKHIKYLSDNDSYLMKTEGTRTKYANTHMQIEIHSPSHTKSIVKPYYTEMGTVDTNAYLLSNAFYLEDLSSNYGNWKIKIYSEKQISQENNEKGIALNFKVYGIEK
ncbi:MAG: S8 family serine peptidase [Succinivibrionaceae bacterium]